nr:bifunctional fucokinase/fucose pyrophosphorylase [Tanacetum cinerariifolium]
SVLAGYAFVYFEDERDSEDAIHALDNSLFGYDRRIPSVEWARGKRGRHRDGSKAVSVEYALRDDGERGSRSISPRRDYGHRGDSPYRSRSPYRRDRPTPDYGRARSPVYDKYRGPSYDSIKRLAELAKTEREALMNCNMDELGDIMMETWRLHQELDPHCSNEFVDSLFAFADRYFCGYKLVGAGGGGFALLLAKNGEMPSNSDRPLKKTTSLVFDEYVCMF